VQRIYHRAQMKEKEKKPDCGRYRRRMRGKRERARQLNGRPTKNPAAHEKEKKGGKTPTLRAIESAGGGGGGKEEWSLAVLAKKGKKRGGRERSARISDRDG